MKQKIAIIGAGFTGLAAASQLIDAGWEVDIFESAKQPGGLASGFSEPGWDWPLEYHYHHVFESDVALQRWLKELGLRDLLFYKATASYSLSDGRLAQLDTPVSLMRFPGLTLLDKIRTGFVLALLNTWPKGASLEKYTAQEFLQKSMGKRSWQKLWQPLFVGKFGQDLASEINLAWFWARVYARSKKLGYFEGGFQGLADQVAAQLEKQGVEFRYSSTVQKLQQTPAGWQVLVNGKSSQQACEYDQVLFTGNSQQLLSLTGDQLPASYQKQLKSLQSLAAMTLVLVLDKPFFAKPIYWLNINQPDWPFLAVVEHTNYISSKKYGGKHLVYVGKYLSAKDKFFKADQKQVLAEYDLHLRKLSPNYQDNLLSAHLFKGRYAQPVVKKNHSRLLPKLSTPLEGLHFAGMEHVYPFDRGINYAIQLGYESAAAILS